MKGCFFSPNIQQILIELSKENKKNSKQREWIDLQTYMISPCLFPFLFLIL